MASEISTSYRRSPAGILAVGLAPEDLARLGARLPEGSLVAAEDPEAALRLLEERRVSDLVADPRTLESLRTPVVQRRPGIRCHALSPGIAHDIEALVGTLTIRALEDQVEQLARAARSLEDFALLGRSTAAILHEVANGLDAARRLAALGLRSPPESPEHARHLEGSLAALDRTVRILHTMLAFVRGAEIPDEPRDAREVVQEALALVEGQRGAITLRTALDPVTASVPGFVVQILVNLLRNAFRAAAPDGEVRVVSRQDGESLRITVEDTGSGFPPADAEAIFAPFGGEPGPRAGLGLGLHLSRRLAERAGGRLVASSPGPGHGARFTLVLPLPGRTGPPARP
jgi:signal transduction histidine kinase